jgi:hypothetical protein
MISKGRGVDDDSERYIVSAGIRVELGRDVFVGARE